MKFPLLTLTSLTCILLIPTRSFSQTDSTIVRTDSVTNKEHTTFAVGLDFYSNLHYFGRTDSLRSTAWVPNVFLQFRKGFFLNSSLIFINSSGQSLKYTAATLGGGYKWGNPGKVKGWTGSIYAAKFFYSNEILIQSTQDGQIGATASYRNKIANINLGTSLAFGDQTDFFMNMGFDHLFKYTWKDNKNIFAFIPSLNFNGGTQNFTNAYYKTRIFPLTDTLVTETSKRFKLLSVEINVPFVYIHNKLAFTFTPGVVFPTSVIK
ncbi:MAG TPA: hypothetical protein VKH37_12655, partial [Ferruginibacter sp.]|nr:hypothetical protein [Ferruginibacter sp.]